MTKAPKKLPSAQRPQSERTNGARRMSEFKEKTFEDHALDDSDILADDYDHECFCPTCGRANPINHTPEWLLNRFSGLMGRILAALIEARRQNKPLSAREVQMAAYATYPNGPPVNAMLTTREMLSIGRRKLWEYGWDIVGPQITGLGYRLVPLVVAT